MRYPLNAVTITQGYRANPYKYGYGAFGHTGIDLRASVGTNLYSPVGGTVKSVNNNSGYVGGKYVIVSGGGYEFYMGHLSKNLVKKGQKVKEGQHIAETGSTGQVTAPHLHFQVRKNGGLVNPTKIGLKKTKSDIIKNMKPTKAQVGNMFNQLGVADNKVTSKQYEHYTSRTWSVLGFDIAKAIRKKWLDARKQRDSAKKELEKTAKTLKSVREQLAEVKADDIRDEQKKAELTSTITKLEKDLDIATRKITEDDDTNEKVNVIFNFVNWLKGLFNKE